MKTPLLLSWFLVTAAIGAWTDEASAEGKYTRRARARGELTDTAPKLDRYAYIEDTAPKPLEMVMVVDTWTARRPRNPRLLPLVVALAHEGGGPPLLVTADRFELTWDGAPAPVRALLDDELTCRDAAAGAPCLGTTGPSPIVHDLRMLSRRSALAFDTPRATYRGVQFYRHPGSLRREEVWLPAQTWTSALLYFPVPEDFAAWDERFELRYSPEPGAPPVVSCAFRIQRDPALQSEAMRRARRDLRAEEPKRKDR
jgi:hypothetical protein